MNYFNPYPLCLDETVTSAWKTQIADAAKTPLAELLKQRGGELFPRFIQTYTELRSLPRGARRALQRRLAQSRELNTNLQDWLEQRSGRALQHKLARTLAGTALLLALGQGVAEAKVIVVTTNVPGIAADGKCSLIEAIINANTDTLAHADCLVAGDPDLVAEDHIILPARKSITLRSVYDLSYYGNGLPTITSKITIEGNGAKITRRRSPSNFRLVSVSPTGSLELDKVTLSGGSSSYGGAIFNYGELTITNSTLTGNKANGKIVRRSYHYDGVGGGIMNYWGDLTLTGGTITKNTATFAGGGLASIYGTYSSTAAIYGNRAKIKYFADIFTY